MLEEGLPSECGVCWMGEYLCILGTVLII